MIEAGLAMSGWHEMDAMDGSKGSKAPANGLSRKPDTVDVSETVPSLSRMSVHLGLGWVVGGGAGGCFYAMKLWAVEFNLGFTSDIVPPHPSSYSLGFME